MRLIDMIDIIRFPPTSRKPPTTPTTPSDIETLTTTVTVYGRRLCSALDRINDRLERIERHMANIDNATESLRGLTTVGDSLVTLLTALRQEVKDLKSAGTDPETARKIDVLDETIRAKTAEWAAAAVENTGAAGEPVPEPVPETETEEPTPETDTEGNPI